MANRSIKDSINDAAFAFVKEGFDEPSESNLLAMPAATQEPKPHVEIPRKKKAKSESPKPSTRKSRPTAPDRKSDHLVSVSTRMPSSLFADLKTLALKRQLANETPNSIQEIMTLAAEDWLKKSTG